MSFSSLLFVNPNNNNNNETISELATSPAWKALEAHYVTTMKDVTIKDLFAQDPKRFDSFSMQFEDILLDYWCSKPCFESVIGLLLFGFLILSFLVCVLYCNSTFCLPLKSFSNVGVKNRKMTPITQFTLDTLYCYFQ